MLITIMILTEDNILIHYKSLEVTMKQYNLLTKLDKVENEIRIEGTYVVYAENGETMIR